MRKAILNLILLLALATPALGQLRAAVNWSDATAVTVNATKVSITGLENSGLWFKTSTKVYYTMKSTTTPNTTMGNYLDANCDVDLYPLRFTTSDSVTFVTTGAEGYVNYIFYEIND